MDSPDTDNAAVRIGILEDNVQFSAYLCEIVRDEPGLRLSFCAATVADALAALAQGAPDLLLVDMQLPDGSGLDLVRHAVATTACRIMMLTVLVDRQSVLGAFECGAHGYLLKDTPPEQIVRDINAIMSGAAPISAGAATHILTLFQRVPEDAATAPTPRERELIQMIARGLTYAEAAQAMGISVHTVADYIKTIYRKLDVNSKNEAVFEARNQGWITRMD
jgi:DNA-binding NarL/FixJ family response regulator